MPEMNTKYFGKIAYQSQEIFHFPQGLFGFETEHDFLMLPFAENDKTIFCLQSVANEALAFIVMDPFAFLPEYHPMLTKKEYTILHATDQTALRYYVICVMRDTVAESTANLKCPVAMNPDQRMALQIILEDAEYTFRHSFQSLAQTKSAKG